MTSIVYLAGNKYSQLLSDAKWDTAYVNIAQAFHDNGLEVLCDPAMKWNKPSFVVEKDSHTDSDSIYVYNHKTIHDVDFVGKMALFVKPTGPHPGCTTIDEVGYSCISSITYLKPNYESMDPAPFYNAIVPILIAEDENKWSDNKKYKSTELEEEVTIPDDHILVLTQMPGDTTCTDFSFGNHWAKVSQIVDKLLKDGERNIVIKLHPTFKSISTENGSWNRYAPIVAKWRNQGLLVLEDRESLHKILPHTRVAILENSTAGLECMMHNVPMISYGYPEYHWITFDMRHLINLREALKCQWFKKEASRQWLTWYYTRYLCIGPDSTKRRIDQLLGTLHPASVLA